MALVGSFLRQREPSRNPCEGIWTLILEDKILAARIALLSRWEYVHIETIHSCTVACPEKL